MSNESERNNEKDLQELEAILDQLIAWSKKYHQDYVSMSVIDNCGSANCDPDDRRLRVFKRFE